MLILTQHDNHKDVDNLDPFPRSVLLLSTQSSETGSSLPPCLYFPHSLSPLLLHNTKLAGMSLHTEEN